MILRSSSFISSIVGTGSALLHGITEAAVFIHAFATNNGCCVIILCNDVTSAAIASALYSTLRLLQLAYIRWYARS